MRQLSGHFFAPVGHRREFFCSSGAPAQCLYQPWAKSAVCVMNSALPRMHLYLEILRFASLLFFIFFFFFFTFGLPPRASGLSRSHHNHWPLPLAFRLSLLCHCRLLSLWPTAYSLCTCTRTTSKREFLLSFI